MMNEAIHRTREAYLMAQVPAGAIFEHYKGKKYRVLSVGRHSETLVLFVVYEALYNSEFGENSVWIRPLEMFLENVNVNGIETPRFRKIEE